MIDSLKNYGYPDKIVKLTKDIYTNSHFKVESCDGYTDLIHRQRGIIQGCPYSVIVFEQGVDIWLRWMMGGNNLISIPNPVQGYVDDIALCSINELGITEMCHKTGIFVNSTGMAVKHRKCATLHGQSSGNNWCKRDSTSGIQISIQY